MADDIKKEMKQLIMLVSSIRSQDQDHWESHVEFTNQVIDFIKKIQDDMNKNWAKINKNIKKLNGKIENSMDSLLSGINPEGVKETSKYLKEIQGSMQESMTSMNLESIMQDLQSLTGAGIQISTGKKKKEKQVESLKSGKSSPYSKKNKGKSRAKAAPASNEGFDAEGYTPEEQEMIKAYQEIYGPGHIPEHLKKKKKKKEPHLMKPSDFFGM